MPLPSPPLLLSGSFLPLVLLNRGPDRFPALPVPIFRFPHDVFCFSDRIDLFHSKLYLFSFASIFVHLKKILNGYILIFYQQLENFPKDVSYCLFVCLFVYLFLSFLSPRNLFIVRQFGWFEPEIHMKQIFSRSAFPIIRRREDPLCVCVNNYFQYHLRVVGCTSFLAVSRIKNCQVKLVNDLINNSDQMVFWDQISIRHRQM